MYCTVHTTVHFYALLYVSLVLEHYNSVHKYSKKLLVYGSVVCHSFRDLLAINPMESNSELDFFVDNNSVKDVTATASNIQ